jgi:RNA polymerase sigma-70 factor (ECF subfamily)
VTTATNTLGVEKQSDSQESRAFDHLPSHAKISDLIKKQYSGLLTLVRRKLKDRELATDLVNEAIVITLEHARLGRLTNIESIGGYVFKVSMNLLRNYERNIDNRIDLRVNGGVMESLAKYDSDDLEADQIRNKTQQLIELLSSPRDREVIKRFYLDEDDKQIICNELSLTPLQFTQVMSRARQRMKQIFESQGLKHADFFSVLL